MLLRALELCDSIIYATLLYSCSAVRNLNARKPLGSPDKKGLLFLSLSNAIKLKSHRERERVFCGVLRIACLRYLQPSEKPTAVDVRPGLCVLLLEGTALSRLSTCLNSFPVTVCLFRLCG